MDANGDHSGVVAKALEYLVEDQRTPLLGARGMVTVTLTNMRIQRLNFSEDKQTSWLTSLNVLVDVNVLPEGPCH